MRHVSEGDGVPTLRSYRRARSILLWLAVSTGLGVSLFSLIDEMCLATACSDAASFTFFGVGMAWIGIAYFGIMLLLLWLRHKVTVMDRALTVLLFSGVGAELRLIWIQKYVIGSWCPLCVTICCALFVAAMAVVAEKVEESGSGGDRAKSLPGLLAFVTALIAIGLAIAVAGVHALT